MIEQLKNSIDLLRTLYLQALQTDDKSVVIDAETIKDMYDIMSDAKSMMSETLPVVHYIGDKKSGNWKVLCPRCHRTLMERITTEEGSEPIFYNTSGLCNCGQRVVTTWKTVDALKELQLPN